VTEQNPVAVPQQRRDDASLRRAFRGDRHRRIVPPVVSDTVPCRAGKTGQEQSASLCPAGQGLRSVAARPEPSM
jgi:hypothetical protein